HALALARVGGDVHLAPVEHVVAVDEVGHGRVEGLGLVVGDEQPLGLEDGVDLGAVVRHVVDDLDLLVAHALVGPASVVHRVRSRSVTDGAGHARRGPVGDGGVELASPDAVAGVPTGRAHRGRATTR